MTSRRIARQAGLLVTVFATVLWLSDEPAATEMWKCTRGDGRVLFQDGSGHGCRPVEVLPELQSTGGAASSGPTELPSRPVDQVLAPAKAAPGPVPAPALSSRPFVPTSRTVPSLSYHDLSPALRARGWSIPNKGDVALLQLEVSHWPAGNGPFLVADHHFKDWAQQTLRDAVLAAAKAVGYDPRFLRVRLTMPVGSILYSGVRMDGPSAGVAWAVAVTAALLSDPIRPDVCLSGTIDLDLAVGPVGGLEHKIDGCRMLPQFHEMLVPAGQNTFAITDKGMARSITVREVATLAEAYEAATGNPLRSAP